MTIMRSLPKFLQDKEIGGKKLSEYEIMWNWVNIDRALGEITVLQQETSTQLEFSVLERMILHEAKCGNTVCEYSIFLCSNYKIVIVSKERKTYLAIGGPLDGHRLFFFDDVEDYDFFNSSSGQGTGGIYVHHSLLEGM